MLLLLHLVLLWLLFLSLLRLLLRLVIPFLTRGKARIGGGHDSHGVPVIVVDGDAMSNDCVIDMNRAISVDDGANLAIHVACLSVGLMSDAIGRRYDRRLFRGRRRRRRRLRSHRRRRRR